MLPGFREPTDCPFHPFRRFPLGEYHFRKPAPILTMKIERGVSEVGHGRIAQPSRGRSRSKASPGMYLFEHARSSAGDMPGSKNLKKTSHFRQPPQFYARHGRYTRYRPSSAPSRRRCGEIES